MIIFDAAGRQRVTDAALGRTRGKDSHQQQGTTDIECWYPVGELNAAPFTSGGTTLGRMYLKPLPVCPWERTIDGIEIEATAGTAAGEAAVVGVYANLDHAAESDEEPGMVLYPGALVGQTSALDLSTTGVKSETSLAIVLEANRQYWLVSHFNAATSMRLAASGANSRVIAGTSTVLGASITEMFFDRTYSATMPSVFPPGATVTTSGAPAVWYRLAA